MHTVSRGKEEWRGGPLGTHKKYEEDELQQCVVWNVPSTKKEGEGEEEEDEEEEKTREGD